MTSIRFAPIAALLVCVVCSPAWSLDPRHADILTLQLGMTRANVIGLLAGQGYRSEGGPESIAARTRDGAMAVDFAPDGLVHRIVYKLNGRGPNETAVLRDAMIDYYGPPTSDRPLTWCVAASPIGLCSPSEPLLTYAADKDGKGVLTLSDRPAP